MNHPATFDDVLKAKEERRKRLAALPISERVALIEKLHDLAVTMREVREKQKAFDLKTGKSSIPLIS